MPRRTADLINLPLDWYRQMRATQPVWFDDKFKSCMADEKMVNDIDDDERDS